MQVQEIVLESCDTTLSVVDPSLGSVADGNWGFGRLDMVIEAARKTSLLILQISSQFFQPSMAASSPTKRTRAVTTWKERLVL
jgi:hypothetical protein